MDDCSYVFSNPDLRFDGASVKRLLTVPVLNLYTPLQMASYLVDYSIAGLKPWIYHLHNIFWHLLAVYFVWRFFRELGITRFTALCCAAAFALHPQRAESVVWIAERKDVLATAFFTATMCFFLCGRRHRKAVSIPALCCMLAAMMSKPQALVLPAVLYLLEVHRTRRWLAAEHLKAVMPYCILSISYGVIVRDMIKNSGVSVLQERRPVLLTATHVIYNYLRFAGKTFCPSGLLPLYPFIIFSRELVILTFAGAAAAVALLAAVWQRSRELFLYDILPMVLCFGGILLPVSGIIFFSNADFADRYSYIPSIFLWGAAGLVLDKVKWRKFRFSMPAAALYLAALTVSLVLYMPVWKNNNTLLTACTAVEKPNFAAIIYLSSLQFAENEPDMAMETVKKFSLDACRHQSFKQLISYYNTLSGVISRYMRGNRTVLPELRTLTAPELLEPILARNFLEPVNMALKVLAMAEIREGNIPAAAEAYRRVSRCNAEDDRFTAEFFRGVAAMLEEKPAVAVSHFQRALQLNPGDENTIRNLEMAYRKEKENESHFENQSRND